MLSLDVVKIERCTYNTGYVMPYHQHQFYHFMYILSGSGDITINSKKTKCSQMDCFLFSPECWHGYSVNGEKPLITLDCKFSLDADLIEQTMISNLCNNNNHIKNTIVVNMLGKILSEATKNDIFRRDLINAYFTEVLVILLRKSDFVQDVYLDSTKDNTDDLNNDGNILLYTSKTDTIHIESFNKIMSFINSNLDKHITLKFLSNMAGYSEVYFSETFKSIYNYYPIQYINKIRIEKAKELLKYTNKTIDEISVVLGFWSREHFSKSFKKNLGITPVSYRRNYANDLEVVFSNKYNIGFVTK